MYKTISKVSFIVMLGLFIWMPTSLSAEEQSTAPWRVGAGVGGFKMTASFPSDSATYKKILPGYTINVGYMALPWLETGILLSGGDKGVDTQGRNQVELQLPRFSQVYLRVRQAGRSYGFYEMIMLGSRQLEAGNAKNNAVLSDSGTAILGAGAGVSWYVSRNLTLDFGAFVPDIGLGKQNSGLKTTEAGVLFSLNYAFGAEAKVADAPSVATMQDL